MNISDETFVREVDEELQRDRLLGFWKSWGRWAIGGIVALVAAYGGWLYWSHTQEQKAAAEGEKLIQAIETLETNANANVAPQLTALADSKSEGYRAAAKLTEAATALSKGDTKFAIETYGKVAADDSLSQPWRDLALVRQTALEFDAMKPEAIVARLKPLAVSGNAWFGSAGEMVALAYARMNKNDLAAKMFADIAKDEKVSESIRGRAKAMATSLEPASVQPVVSKPAVSKDVSQ